jgi:hypothetical protein
VSGQPGSMAFLAAGIFPDLVMPKSGSWAASMVLGKPEHRVRHPYSLEAAILATATAPACAPVPPNRMLTSVVPLRKSSVHN